MESESRELGRIEMKPLHRGFLIAAFVVVAVRVILRAVFTIMAKSALGAPLIVSGLLTIVILIQLWFKGGCTPTFLYAILEPLMCTIFWFVLIFGIDTTESCFHLGDTYCESIDSSSQLSNDYVRRPHAWWVAVIIPGLIFDLLFLFVFRKPLVVKQTF